MKKDSFLFTSKLADSLGLEMAIAGSPGWSESGGPWVKSGQAMKKFVWSETRIAGEKPFRGVLPKPPSTTGAFQNIVSAESFSLSDTEPVPVPEFYADAVVVAFRLPDTDLSLSELKPIVTSSGGKFDLGLLTDGDLQTTSVLPFTKPGENAWIQFEFARPETMQALTIVGGGSADMFGFTLKTPPPQLPVNIGAGFGFDSGRRQTASVGTQIAELVLHKVARVNRFEEKAAFAAASDLYSLLLRL